VQVVFLLLAPLEIAHIFANKEPATSAYLFAVTDTNWNEFTELLQSAFILIICLLLVWILYFYLLFKKIRSTYTVHSKKHRLYALGFYVLLLISGYFIGCNQKIYPYSLIYRSYQTYSIQKEMREGREKMQNFRFGAKKEDAISEREVYILVIGETGRYSSFSVNGYKRNTSPLLSATEHLVCYSNFFSEANITSSSLPILLTRADAQNYNRSYVEKSLVDAFHEAGFRTCWFSTQSIRNNFIYRISNDADESHFFETGFKKDDNYDEKLWAPLDKVLAGDNSKVLIVLHTLGSHFKYNKRYPPEFDTFKPSFSTSSNSLLASPKHKEQFVNTYDNSILYTDYFLANTIKKLDSLNCVSTLVYLSDHGENLFDTEENIVLHGGSQYTEYDFHIPFFVWTSDQYRLHYPSKVENIEQHKDKKLSASFVFYSLLDMANITFPEQKLIKSIASDVLQEDSVRYFINTNMEVVRWIENGE
jgi:glucan phosphoethanolaminetransferase (alkaline phosphatase superfamily)